MTNNKLSPVTVYVPVKNKIGIHIYHNTLLINHLKDSAHFDQNGAEKIYTPSLIITANGNDFVSNHYLSKEEKYVFNREELEGLLKDAFEQFLYRPFPHNEPTFEQYIQSLF